MMDTTKGNSVLYSAEVRELQSAPCMDYHMDCFQDNSIATVVQDSTGVRRKVVWIGDFLLFAEVALQL